MKPMFKNLGYALVLLGAGMGVAWSQAGTRPPGTSDADIERVAQKTMRAFNVPGIAVGIVKDGKLVFAHGYGVREAGKPDKVDADTIFAIGSISKAFTTAALAILVDAGKLGWDDRVIDHLPDFRLADPYVTREFTVRDLLTHRSGLGLGAGDLMIFPNSDFTRAEVVAGMRYLPFVTSFRSTFAYDNLLYIVAGELIPAITGKSWEDFVEQRILNRVGMAPCAVVRGRLQGTTDIASPHVVVDGKPRVVSAALSNAAAPAGSINCNVTNMAKWLTLQMAGGKLADGSTLFSPEQHAAMWQPETLLEVSPEITELNRTHFQAYGLGWGLGDFEGYLRVQHSGGVGGTVTHVSMLPELNLGVIVLTNQESGEALNAVTMHLLKAYALAGQKSRPNRDWVDFFKAIADQKEKANSEIEAAANAATTGSAGPAPLPLSAYAGTYNDPWRGAATIRQEGDKLVLKFSRTTGLEGPLQHNGGGIFVVRWNDRSLYADAYVRFSYNYDGSITGMTMKAVSPRTDFSFDFHDLNFTKVQAPQQ